MKIHLTEALATTRLQTPIGELRLAASDEGLRAVLFETDPTELPEDRGSGRARAHLASARAALEEYFAGRRKTFEGVTLAAQGTAFQLQVWRALSLLPFGETVSYATLAKRIGRPAAVRAVGLANGRNPLPLIVPCHRVIGSNGTLTGFAGGLPAKKWLLEFEGALTPNLLSP
ncbi:methylated-DNA--[protein]-cysteine S-methyltransferase [Stigmatella aurantiaca]|uniref:Methylated-DNA--protein-cysteine methyltransferase n=1 Tax=Stigmatella aurantiaca (strain DW4/3-1) TaxID=378806 RepID=Q08TA2_STIAD|nr:methylated-DNA--[protein]-cysteine S-methyltransferase [Stigmatella aurantiaca]ADO68758.1 Methylated-DNA-protein-cysteine methyltransferase [Stigmatella aurantiaca DW4/3-1]EAU63705.1 methylated-DNA--protein-cysteine methyltransferase [Stigmatella aurantiaca DW4/3-1]